MNKTLISHCFKLSYKTLHFTFENNDPHKFYSTRNSSFFLFFWYELEIILTSLELKKNCFIYIYTYKGAKLNI